MFNFENWTVEKYHQGNVNWWNISVISFDGRGSSGSLEYEKWTLEGELGRPGVFKVQVICSLGEPIVNVIVILINPKAFYKIFGKQFKMTVDTKEGSIGKTFIIS